jgi:hypothetical protein
MNTISNLLRLRTFVTTLAMLSAFGASHAATLSLQQNAYNVARTTSSPVISIVVTGDGITNSIEGSIAVNLAQYDFVQINTSANLGAIAPVCLINNGRLFVAAIDFANYPLPSYATTICKFSLRPRGTAPLGWYNFTFSNVSASDNIGQATPFTVGTGWINVTP